MSERRPHGKIGTVLGLWIAVAALVSGFATNAMTGRTQLSIVSEKTAIAQAASAYDSMVGDLKKQNKLSTDGKTVARVHLIADKLIQQAVRYRPDIVAWSWEIEVIDDPEVVNAFCMPGGRMAVYSGLIEKVSPTDDELAQVIGHEIAHALAGHGAEKMSHQAMANAVVLAARAAGRNSSQQQANQNIAAFAALAFINLPNSRETESEADKLGIELAAKAGYDPAAAVSLWEKMMKATGNKSKFDFLSTHPAPPRRIEALTELQPPMRRYFDEARQRKSPPRPWTSEKPEVRAADKNLQTQEPALAFYSPEMDRFENGTLRLTCDQCSSGFLLNGQSMQDKYAARDWRGLAQEVIKTNYAFDLSYYYLAVAADGFSYRAASRIYAGEALRLAETKDQACGRAILLSCNGIDVRQEAGRLAGPSREDESLSEKEGRPPLR